METWNNHSKIDLAKITATAATTIREAMAMINNRAILTMIIVIDEKKTVKGTVTDGDIRRGLLRGLTLDAPIREIMNKNPIVVPYSIGREAMLELMRVNSIFHLPVIDAAGKLMGVEERLPSLADEAKDELTAILMAGGEGQRLRPLTENTPKPMLEVCGKPILQILIECLRNYGFKKIIIVTGYLGHVIEDYFKDGKDFKINIHYIREPQRLGTAGALGILPKELKPTRPFLVVNGDLMTNLNFRMFRDFHINGNYTFTLCGRPHKVEIPFGYPYVEGDLVTRFQEKPLFTYLVNSGIYSLSPELLNYVPVNKFFNMTELIDLCIK